MGGAHAAGDVGARLVADEEVDERDVRLVAPGAVLGLVAGRRRHAALDPVLLDEDEAHAPVDDVVVVDDQHAESARRDGGAHDGLGSGRTRRTCQRSGG